MTLTYDAYGFRADEAKAHSAYTGQRAESDIGWYLLGDRPYGPQARRFLSADTLSPFDAGGPNRYAYCGGDPINRVDPSGHAFADWLRRIFGRPTDSGIQLTAYRPSGDHVAAGFTTHATPAAAAGAEASVQGVMVNQIPIEPTRPAQQGAPPATAVLGSLNSGAGTMTRPPLPGSPRVAEQPASLPPSGRNEKRRVHIVSPGDPNARLPADRKGKARPTLQWAGYGHDLNPSSRIWVADTAIKLGDVEALMDDLAAKGTPRVFLYSGARGVPDGNNWHEVSQLRRYRSPWGLRQAIKKFSGRYTDMQVHIEPIGSLTMSEFQKKLSRNGTHVLDICYGAADPGVMKSVQLNEVFAHLGRY